MSRLPQCANVLFTPTTVIRRKKLNGKKVESLTHNCQLLTHVEKHGKNPSSKKKILNTNALRCVHHISVKQRKVIMSITALFTTDRRLSTHASAIKKMNMMKSQLDFSSPKIPSLD